MAELKTMIQQTHDLVGQLSKDVTFMRSELNQMKERISSLANQVNERIGLAESRMNVRLNSLEKYTYDGFTSLENRMTAL